MLRFQGREFYRLFKLKQVLLLCLVGTSVLLAVAPLRMAVGFTLGCGLYAVKSFFHFEAGRSLVNARSRRSATIISVLSTLGRMGFLAVCLVGIVHVSLQAFYAACGGLLLSQITLHVSSMTRKGAGECSNT